MEEMQRKNIISNTETSNVAKENISPFQRLKHLIQLIKTTIELQLVMNS